MRLVAVDLADIFHVFFLCVSFSNCFLSWDTFFCNLVGDGRNSRNRVHECHLWLYNVNDCTNDENDLCLILN